MPDPATAIIGGGSIIGGALSSRGASKAASAQTNAAQAANELQWKMYQQSRQDQLPWLQAGQVGLQNLIGTPIYAQPTQTTLQDVGATTTPVTTSPGFGTPDDLRAQYDDYYAKQNRAWQEAITTTAGGDSGVDKPMSYENWLASPQRYETQGALGISDSLLGSLGAGPSFWDKAGTALGLSGEGQSAIDEREIIGYEGGLLGGPTLADFYESPSYQFNLAEGEKGINRALAARGLYGSGKALKDLTRFSQGLASNEYQNFVNNWISTKLNPNLAVAGLGQVAGTSLGSLGAGYAGQMGTNLQNAGTARALGYQAQSNIWNQGLQGIGNMASMYMANQNPSGSIWGGGYAGTGPFTSTAPVSGPGFQYQSPYFGTIG